MVDQFQTAEQLRTFMNMYGFQEEPYLKEKLFYLCSSEVESEDINSAKPLSLYPDRFWQSYRY